MLMKSEFINPVVLPCYIMVGPMTRAVGWRAPAAPSSALGLSYKEVGGGLLNWTHLKLASVLL